MAADNKASYLHGLNNCAGSCGFHDYKGWKFAIKTGTTNDGYDGLMASWSSRYAAMTWVGYHTRTKAMSGAMEVMTAPIVRGWMQAAHDKAGKAENWARPAGVKDQPAFVIRSKVSRLGEVIPSSATDIFPSWYTAKAGNTEATTIDKVSNKLATSCTPDAAKDNVSNSNANKFSVDQFVTGGAASSSTDTDDVHKCEDTKPGVALTIASSKNGNPTSVCDKDGCSITATVAAGSHPLFSDKFPGKLVISINGTVVQSFDITNAATPQTFTADYKPTTSGAANVTATVTDSVLYGTTIAQDVTLSADNQGDNH